MIRYKISLQRPLGSCRAAVDSRVLSGDEEGSPRQHRLALLPWGLGQEDVFGDDWRRVLDGDAAEEWVAAWPDRLASFVAGRWKRVASFVVARWGRRGSFVAAWARVGFLTRGWQG